MDDERIIGQIDDIKYTGPNKTALLRPLYALDRDAEEWIFLANTSKKFPNRGLVSWWKPSEDASLESLWIFTYEPSSTFDPAHPGHDQYRTPWDKPPELLTEVLDIGVQNDDVLVKLDQGLRLPFTPSRRLYIALNDQTWAGPVKLVSEGGRLFLDPQQRQNPIDSVARLPQKNILRLHIDGGRTFVWPNAPQPIKTAELDWAPNELVIKRLLTAAAKNNEIRRVFTLTKATIRQIADTLPSIDDSISEQQISRARRYLDTIEHYIEDIDAFETEILALPTVQERISVAEQEGRLAATAQAEAKLVKEAKKALEQLQEEHRKLTQLVQKTKAQQQALESEMKHLNEEIVARQQKIDSQINFTDALITERLADIMAKPAEALSHIALVRAALGTIPSAGTTTSHSNHSIHPPLAVLKTSEQTVEDQQQLLKTLRQVFASAQQSSTGAIFIHSTLLAGLMPLLSGVGAFETFERYASITCGGRMVWINIPPSILEPADILGRFDSQAHHFMPHPNSLIDLLIFASQPEQQDKLFLAVLDGVNRSAIDAYLLPLLRCYQSIWNTPHALSLAHPAVFPDSDPYRSASRLIWPSNVLLGGILADGAATLPPPLSLWPFAAFKIADSPKQATQSSASMSVSSSDWVSWRTELGKESESGLQTLQDIIDDEIALPAPISRNFAHIYTASRKWLKKDEEAISLALSATLAPYMVSNDQDELLNQIIGQSVPGANFASEIRNIQRAIL